MAIATSGLVDEARARRWLTSLARPQQLDDPEMRALLRAHGRPATGSPLDVGRAAARLLVDSIEKLGEADASPASSLSYRVLRTCFVDGLKNRQAAARLGLSERQLSRERTRALSLVAAELASAVARAPSADPPPVPRPFLPRPAVAAAVADALRARRDVCVAGAAGAGKTALVAALAATAGCDVFWYRADAGCGAELGSVLFELGEHVAGDDPALAGYLRSALPHLDLGLATRLALAALRSKPRLLVFDGLAHAPDRSLAGFLSEVVARLPLTSVVTVTRGGRNGGCVRVPPLDAEETRALLALHGVDDVSLATALHRWTAGNARLVGAAAGWLAPSADRRAGAVEDALRQRPLAVTSLRGLTRAARARPACARPARRSASPAPCRRRSARRRPE